MSVVDYRRALHRIPELDNQLPETVEAVKRILTPLPCRIFSPSRPAASAPGSTRERATPWPSARSWTPCR